MNFQDFDSELFLFQHSCSALRIPILISREKSGSALIKSDRSMEWLHGCRRDFVHCFLGSCLSLDTCLFFGLLMRLLPERFPELFVDLRGQ